MRPPVSIVINTLNRAESLRRTLLSLWQLNYAEFEVVVVVGPSTDKTDAVLGKFQREVKLARCENTNLSMSRNIGIRCASGALVAFIDDDSVPDPWWLDDVVPAFDDPEVSAAGGPVYDHDGATLFTRYSLTDVHGDTMIRKDGVNPSRLLAAPLSDLVVYPIGTNAIFRRSALVALGGFDEELGHYFDDADIGRRLVDKGWVVQACDRGFVYHFRLPSATRTPQRVTRDMYPYLRSRAYFAVRHARRRVGLVEIAKRYEQTVDRVRADRRWCLEVGLLESDDVETFERDAIHAGADGMESALQEPRLHPPGWFDEGGSTFLPLARALPARRLHLCIVTQEYLPQQLNGIARLSHELAVALADRGHVVRILTAAEQHAGVDLENGVWVHRIAALPTPPPAGIKAPARIWDFSASVLRELQRISHAHPVDIVQMPNWNSEGIAVLLDGSHNSVLGLHTPLETIARLDSRIDPQNPEVRELLTLERSCYLHASAFLACGPASLKQIEDDYGIELPRERIGYVPFGIPDRRSSAPLRVPDRVNVLFVGRLEARKGIDTLLEAIALVLPELGEVAFTIVGNDSIPSESGRTYREEFERLTDASLREGRVFFRGVAPDEELDRLYAGCDIFVAPSRSESFGLILLEAMREAKPVVAGDVGGMREVVEHERNGLLVPPGDAEALAEALRHLAMSVSLRDRYGRRSRVLFDERFTAVRMAEGYEQFCTSVLDTAAAR